MQSLGAPSRSQICSCWYLFLCFTSRYLTVSKLLSARTSRNQAGNSSFGTHFASQLFSISISLEHCLFSWCWCCRSLCSRSYPERRSRRTLEHLPPSLACHTAARPPQFRDPPRQYPQPHPTQDQPQKHQQHQQKQGQGVGFQAGVAEGDWAAPPGGGGAADSV